MNNDLKNEIKKLEKSKIELGRIPKLLEDNKVRTFAPPDKVKEILKSKEISEDFDSDKFFRDEEN